MRFDERDGREHFYVLEDASLIAQPTQWARRAVAAFERWNADLVVAEVNQGGDMVETTLHNIAPNLPVHKVRATRGKIVRAEPISVLYSQGRVHHVGDVAFEELEDEMSSYTGAVTDESPDRLDALVWALTELSMGTGAVDGGTLYFG